MFLFKIYIIYIKIILNYSLLGCTSFLMTSLLSFKVTIHIRYFSRLFSLKVSLKFYIYQILSIYLPYNRGVYPAYL